jgi:hypothetical protein
VKTAEAIQTDTRTIACRVAAVAALLSLAWTLLVVTTGGVRVALGPLLLSSRGPMRPAIVFGIAYALSLLLGGRASRRGGAWTWLRVQLERVSPVFAVVAAASVFAVALTYGARAASGADTFGYVSQASLWLKGNLHVSEPLAAELPWPRAIESVSSLGYRPGEAPNTVVPTYSPGLPLIMAAFHTVAGSCGPYYVQPTFGAVLVLVTFGLAWRLSCSGSLAALAAIFIACAPAFLFNLMTPMSDSVTAALWTLSLLLLTWRGIAPAVLAGLVAGLSILVRPNLAPLAAAGALAAWFWPLRPAALAQGEPLRLSSLAQTQRVVALAAALVPAVIIVAIVNDRLYGSPTMSGYGPASSLYALRLFPGNVERYSRWLLQSEGIFVLLALVPLLVPRARPEWLTRGVLIPTTTFAVVLGLSYLFYVHFRDWWYLRFFLPAYPLLVILLAAPVAAALRAVPAMFSLPALVVAVALAMNYWLGFLIGLGTLRIGRGEDRYVAVAQYVERELPPNAIILSMQHSGTIKFYSGRPTVRYDVIAPARLPSAIEWFTANHYRPYILVENWEEAVYREHFAELPGPLANLDRLIVAELARPVGIRLYDPLQPFNAARTPDQIQMPDESRCAPPRGPWGQ